LQDLDGTVADTISNRVWLPLGAADAALWGVDDASLRLDCCVVARIEDWMRVADLFLQQGSYQGQRIVSPDWIRQLLAEDAQGQPHPVWLDRQLPWAGDEPPAARGIYWFDLGTDARLWLVPRRGLAILYWADAARSRDTLVANIILRGLQDQLPTGGTNGLNDLVPGH
jgi:CubicO group peptidase (beta-lactamase class C family)